MSRRDVLIHLAVVTVLVAATVATGLVALHHSRAASAIADAEIESVVVGRRLVEPVLRREVIAGQRPALDRLDRVVHEGVLNQSLLRVKLWRTDGTIVYSDEPRLIGSRFFLTEAQRGQLADGTVDAAVTDMVSAEHRYEPEPRMLEVYTPVHADDGTPLLLETYFRYGDGMTGGTVGTSGLVVPLLGGLALALVAGEAAFIGSVRRRVRRAALRHDDLLVDAVTAERRRIARGLHDGVVQDLTGAALQLGSVGHAELGPLVGPVAATVRESIRSLRSLLVDIYPPSLHADGLDAALADLLAALNGRGVATHLFVGVDLASLVPGGAEALYRAAQEALRNVAAHSGATTVRVSLTADAEYVVLTVEDNGRGFLAGSWPQQTVDGHIGLQATEDLLAGVGGRLNIRSFPGEGTRVTARVRRYRLSEVPHARMTGSGT